MKRADVIGTGRLGKALTAWLADGGWQVDRIVSRDAARARRLAKRLGAKRGQGLSEYRQPAELVFVAVPDDALAGLARRLAQSADEWSGKVVLHASGALDASVLSPLHKLGASTGSLHPLMTFARRGEAPSPKEVVFAVEGDRKAEKAAFQLAKLWGGKPLQLRPEQKPAYHLAATFASPMIVVVFALAREQLRRSGLNREAQARAAAGLQRLLKQTAANLGDGSTAAARSAWTGAIARGDRETIRRHRAIAGPSRHVYDALVASAERLLGATGAGRRSRSKDRDLGNDG